eukprot:1413100-Lingulodinium_polyedra.AAC.1
MPKRGVSERKALAAFDSIAESRAEKARCTLRDKITTELKEAEMPKLLAIEAILYGHSESCAPEACFPRGIETYGGLRPKCVTDKVIIQCLHLVTRKPKPELEKLDRTSLKNAWMLSIGRRATDAIPARRMRFEDFYKHYVAEYQLHGCLFRHISPEMVDWNLNTGVYKIIK